MTFHLMHNIVSARLLLGWFLLGNFGISNAVESDISCLKSLKDSLQGPFYYLSAWNFNNTADGSMCTFFGIACWHASDNMILSIELSDMGLKGEFPRGLEWCTSLTSLNLSRNQLSGPIPVDIGQRLKYLTKLDLSYNSFSGVIPPSIANCSYLLVLILDFNHLTGSIPSEIGYMSRIKNFSIIHNSLEGPVPYFSQAQISPECYANNLLLCGHPLEPCKDEVTPENNNRALLITGFLTGWALSTIFTLYVCVFGIQSIGLKGMIPNKSKKRRPDIIDGGSPRQKTKAIEEHSQKIAKIEKYVARISFAEVANATTNFSSKNIIGIGKMGTLYKARLPNGWPLAIKLLFSSELEAQIVSEMMTLGRIRHRRFVPLVGFCFERQAKILIYNYMANGSLHDWLHSKDSQRKIIAWPLRVKIAVGIAEGLAWFHLKYEFKASHGSISSQCILLDENFEPRISNFWEAKLLKPTELISSWMFLRPSESSEKMGFDEKDVYSFGILLLELVTGKDHPELARFVENIGDFSAALLDVDENLIQHGFDNEIVQFLELAKNCLRPRSDRRPSMLQVYRTLIVFSQAFNCTGEYEKFF